MIKKILTVMIVLALAACAPGQRQWDSAPDGYQRQAEGAPSRLIRTPAPVDAQGQQPIYKPYTSPVESAEIYRYDEEGQAVTRESLPSRERRAQMMSERQMPSDFDNVLENYGYIVEREHEEMYAAPSLPPVKVALLLPLSGEHADLGQAMLQAAQLALFDIGYESYELMPRDARATPQGAIQAVQSAIDDGAQLILGPLFAGSVRAAKPIARQHNINMVAFSTDWSLAGDNTFIMGFLPFAQVQRVAEYAIGNGLENIAILAPSNDYSNAVIAAYNSMAYRAGLNTADVARYSPEVNDTSDIVRKFARYDERAYMLEEKKLQLQDYIKQNPQDRAAKTELAELEQKNTAGEPPYDAVLLPLGGDQVRSIANLLSYYDLGPHEVKRLGTGLWDDQGLATEPALDKAWFAAPSPDLRRGFEERYHELYGSHPPRLASLAYDAIALSAVLAKKSYFEQGRPSFERSALTNPNGFAGIDGIFRFRPDGLVERGLAVLEFNNGKITVIDPAPTTFQRLDY